MSTAPDASPISPRFRLRGGDLFALAAFTFALFGYACVSMRPLTMHEARLPELAREMLTNGVWSIPHSGGRPWVERPPLPQWVVATFFAVFGAHVWVARLPGAIAGTITCLLTAGTAARLLGRSVGVLAGFALATMYEFYVYATLAEDEVFLAAVVAACVYLFARAITLPLAEARHSEGRSGRARPRQEDLSSTLR